MITLGIEKGDYVEVDVEERQIVLKPRKLIDPSQGWYWTKEWQEMEADVDDEIEKDQLSAKFESAEEGLKWLKDYQTEVPKKARCGCKIQVISKFCINLLKNVKFENMTLSPNIQKPMISEGCPKKPMCYPQLKSHFLEFNICNNVR